METRPCLCAWDDCAALHDRICEIAPASHAWCQQNIRIQFNSSVLDELSLKNFALREAILKNIPLRQLSANNTDKILVIAPHHFPICLLESRKEHNVNFFTNLLTVSDLGSMDDSENGRQLLKQRDNSATYLMRKHHAYDARQYKVCSSNLQ